MRSVRSPSLCVLLAVSGAGCALAYQPDTYSYSISASSARAEPFGSALSLSGNRLAIGVSGEDILPGGPDDPGVPNAGRAYIYDLGSNTPKTPALTFNNPSPAADDRFGSAVASYDLLIIVGAPGDDTGAADAGGAYLYVVNQPNWWPRPAVTLTSTTPIVNPDPAAGDGFGGAVVISGTWAVIGASADDFGATDAGSAYVYDFASATPTVPVHTLHNPSPALADGFGSVLAISGTRLIVGAPHDDTGAGDAGSAYVYELAGPTPTIPIAVLKSPAPEAAELFGSSVGIVGSRVLVGAPGAGPSAAGKVFVYDLSSAVPTIPVATLNNPSPSPGAGFGSSLATSGTRAVVGARTSENAYVYDFGAALSTDPVSILRDPEPSTEDDFGAAIALVGTTVAIGSPGNETVPDHAGSTHIFVTSWGVPEATDFPGPYSAGSSSNYAMGFSSPEFWAGQSAVNLDGVDAVQGRLRYFDAEGAWMTTSVTGPTTLFFSFRASHPIGGGGGRFMAFVGNTQMFLYFIEPYTETKWKEVALEIPAGKTAVKWQLSAYKGLTGTVFVDQVWTSDDPRPRITNPVPPAAQVGSSFRWLLPVASATPVTLTTSGLPPGLTFESEAFEVSGIPTNFGTFEATFTARNSAGYHVAKGEFLVEPAPTTLHEALDAPAMRLQQQEPGVGWRGVAGLGVDGIDCARFVPPTSGNEPWGELSTTLVGPGKLSFWYRTERSQTAAADGAMVFLYLSPHSQPQTLLAASWAKHEVDIPAGAHTISWRPFSCCGPRSFAAYLDQIMFIPSNAPQILIKAQPADMGVSFGDIQAFDSLFVGGVAGQSFTINNTGTANLGDLALTIDGPDAAEFEVASPPVAPLVVPNGATPFTVRFSPRTPGRPKSAVLHIASNDPNNRSYDIALAGTGLEPVNQMANQGVPMTLSANLPGATALQWRKDGVDIPGAVAGTLTIPSVQPWHIGIYSVHATTAAETVVNDVALLGINGVPTAAWRGLIACYPFDTGPHDLCRPGTPASLVNTTELATDSQRGGIVHVQGKGYIVPPLEGEPAETRGPGGYIQIPRPPLAEGEPFTISLLIKEEGFSYWHGESLFTMGEGAASAELLSHYWIGHAAENYGGPAGPIEPHTSDFILNGSAVAFNNPAWTAYTIAGEGSTLRYYRNGQLMGTTAYPKATAGDFFIGRHWWMDAQLLYSTRLVAKVDDLRFYNRALTAAEVQQLYDVVQCTPAAGSFESWALQYGLVGANAARDADSDRDRLTNWDEFCFGASPVEGTASLMESSLAGRTMTLIWLQRDGVIYSLEESANLLDPWAVSAIVPVLSANQAGVPGGYKRMQVGIPVPASDAPSTPRFFRVGATKAP